MKRICNTGGFKSFFTKIAEYRNRIMTFHKSGKSVD